MRPTQNNVFVSGASGSGKSYFFVDWIVRDLIPWSNATIVTNLPIGVVPPSHFVPPAYEGETFIDRISKRTGQDCSERFILLTDEQLEEWERVTGGPWQLELSGETFLIVDEFANYCYTGMAQPTLEKWQRWLAKARHANCHNLMISQSSQKIPRRVFLEFGEKWQLSDTAGRVIPRLECTEGDLNQLISKLIGRDYGRTQCMVRLNEGGTWTGKDDMPIKRITRSRKIFALYDSFSAPELGGESSNRNKEWEVLSWPSLCLWFVGRNSQAVLIFSTYVALFVAVIAGLIWWLSPDRMTIDEALAGGPTYAGSQTAEYRESENAPLVTGRIGGRDLVSSGSDFWLRQAGSDIGQRPRSRIGSISAAELRGAEVSGVTGRNRIAQHDVERDSERVQRRLPDSGDSSGGRVSSD